MTLEERVDNLTRLIEKVLKYVETRKEPPNTYNYTEVANELKKRVGGRNFHYNKVVKLIRQHDIKTFVPSGSTTRMVISGESLSQLEREIKKKLK